MIVMKDESTGEKYARIVQHKGIREGEDAMWIVSDIIAELKAWGHQGGSGRVDQTPENGPIPETSSKTAAVQTVTYNPRLHTSRVWGSWQGVGK